MGYTYSEASRTLIIGEPLLGPDDLRIVCTEVDENKPDEELNVFISNAHILMMNKLDGYGLDAELMKLIETYLAAHFAAITNPSAQRVTLGPLGEAYFGKVDLGLDYTRYGQMAKSMDPTGKLDPDNKNRVLLKSIGGVTRKGMLGC